MPDVNRNFSFWWKIFSDIERTEKPRAFVHTGTADIFNVTKESTLWCGSKDVAVTMSL
jgi:hypothetical protein